MSNSLLVVAGSLTVLLFLMPQWMVTRGRSYEAQAIVISEVAWSGTGCSANDEWIELYNRSGAAIDLTDWVLRATDGSPDIPLQGTLPAGGFFLLERTDDETVSDIPADQIYSGWLENEGNSLQLLDPSTAVIDSANADGGAWPGGLLSPRHSMERIDPAAADSDANWGTNDGITRSGLDCNGQPINGTPKAPNSTWAVPGAELRAEKRGPETVLPGARITYTLVLSNAGELPAESVWLTDVLPAQVRFLSHTAPFPSYQPVTGTLVWEVGAVPTTVDVGTTSEPITFTLTGQVEAAASGTLVNAITATTSTPGDNPADNRDRVTTTVSSSPGLPPVVIEALYYDGHSDGDVDEGVRLINVSAEAVDLGNWSVTDQETGGEAFFPAGTRLAPGQALWCTRQATAFREQFGFQADFEAGNTDPTVPEMEGSWPRLANDGDECLLRDAEGKTVDAVVYSGGDTALPGWMGAAVEPWSPSSTFGAEGQILYRKRDESTGRPRSDTDTAADWAQDPADQVYGRKVQYPGWDLDAFFWTARITETAELTVAVGPDHLLETVVAQIERAEESIVIETYTLESAVVADALVERLAAGVQVTILLEGSPAGGLDPAQGWICNQIQEAGGQVYFLVNDPVPDRYRYQHAKVILIDDRLVLIGSENLNPSAMPADDKADGTAGRRGVYLITNSPGVVSRVQALLAADIDPSQHGDVATCADVPALCSGLPPLTEPNWTSYTVAFPEPLTVRGEFGFEVVQSPENSLRTSDSLLGLVGRAGAGDTVLVEQFYEDAHWGPADGTPETDPNLRLEAYLDAARRGATVRILLNSFVFADYQNENVDTVAYLRSIARTEGLDLEARLGNPTYLGVHNKMVLVHAGGRGTVHVGSINGSEVSSKANREVALQVQSDAAYEYLKGVFDYDWRHSPLFAYLPIVLRNHEVPAPAGHLLISELFYAASKEEEWVEIVNPTGTTVDLSGFKIGDAERPGVYEGMYQFPAGTRLGAGQVLVVAASASDFRQTHGRAPQFELYDTDPAVPTLSRFESWGTGEWELRNGGDEVLLLDGQNRAVDVVVYGDAVYPGVLAHPGVILPSHSLERFPPFLDSDDCNLDFRDWAFPNPGSIP